MVSSAVLAILGEYTAKFSSPQTVAPGQGSYESGLRSAPTLRATGVHWASCLRVSGALEHDGEEIVIMLGDGCRRIGARGDRRRADACAGRRGRGCRYVGEIVERMQEMSPAAAHV
jgi:hypothetical protein